MAKLGAPEAEIGGGGGLLDYLPSRILSVITPPPRILEVITPRKTGILLPLKVTTPQSCPLKKIIPC